MNSEMLLSDFNSIFEVLGSFWLAYTLVDAFASYVFETFSKQINSQIRESEDIKIQLFNFLKSMDNRSNSEHVQHLFNIFSEFGAIFKNQIGSADFQSSIKRKSLPIFSYSGIYCFVFIIVSALEKDGEVGKMYSPIFLLIFNSISLLFLLYKLCFGSMNTSKYVADFYIGVSQIFMTIMIILLISAIITLFLYSRNIIDFYFSKYLLILFSILIASFPLIALYIIFRWTKSKIISFLEINESLMNPKLLGFNNSVKAIIKFESLDTLYQLHRKNTKINFLSFWKN